MITLAAQIIALGLDALLVLVWQFDGTTVWERIHGDAAPIAVSVAFSIVLNLTATWVWRMLGAHEGGKLLPGLRWYGSALKAILLGYALIPVGSAIIALAAGNFICLMLALVSLGVAVNSALRFVLRRTRGSPARPRRDDGTAEAPPQSHLGEAGIRPTKSQKTKIW